jgi:hypothetical protein
LNLPEHLAALPLTELTFHLRPRAQGRLPRFLGPALRAGLGEALRFTACPMQCGAGEVQSAPTCSHAGLCAYAALFEPPEGPGAADGMRSFVLLAPPVATAGYTEIPHGRTLTFGLRLFGPALRHIPAVIGAVARMCRAGLGPSNFAGEPEHGAREEIALEAVRRLAAPVRPTDRVEAEALVERLVAWECGRMPFELEAVTDPTGAEIWKPGRGAPAQPIVFALGDADPPPAMDRLRLRLVTPLRLEFGKKLEFHPTARTLIRAALLRLEHLSQSYTGQGHGLPVREILDAAATLETREKGLEPVESPERAGPHPGPLVPIGGVVGYLELRGAALRDLAWAIRLAEIVHLGSDTAQGLGRVEIVPAE